MKPWTAFAALRDDVAQWTETRLQAQAGYLLAWSVVWPTWSNGSHRRSWWSRGSSCTSAAFRTLLSLPPLAMGSSNSLACTGRRKCSFYDLASVTPDESAAGERLEVVLKIIDDELSLEQVEAIRYRVKVGDVVHVRGFVELTDHGLLIHARDLVPVRAWKDEHPGETFVPVPTVRLNTTQPQAQQQTQQQPAANGQQHCKFWINSKSCQLGDRCELAHVGEAERKAARAEWLAERLRLKRERAQLEDDPLDPHGKTSKAQRARVFVDWLVATFGEAQLAAGGGVLDVAGGRGDVSFELWNKRRIPTKLVDPVVYNARMTTLHSDGSDAMIVVKQRPMKLSRMQFKFLKTSTTDKAAMQAALVPQTVALFNDGEFLEDANNAELVRRASVLIGLHPDEATDAIIDVALKLDKPFALVPCCVFGQQFPYRRKPDGGRVVSFEDLVEYLAAKSPDIQRAFLSLDGKNMVLYRTGRPPTENEASPTPDNTSG